MGIFNPATWFGGADKGIGGAAQGIGSAVEGVAKVWKVGADANDQRVFDSYNSARSYVPQTWLAKQIRPFVTLTVLSTFIMLNIVICILVFLSIKNFIETDSDDIGKLIKEIAIIFTLLNAPGFLYYAFVGTIMTFWFGGQNGKYNRAHKENIELAKQPVQIIQQVAPKRDNKFVDLLGEDVSKLSKLEQARRAHQATK